MKGRIRRCPEEIEMSNLGFDFHAIAQEDGELSNISKCVLIGRSMVEAEDVRSRILHEVN